MSNPSNLVEVWLRLMSDAMRGTADAQEAMRMLGEVPMTPDRAVRWMTQFMPMMSTGSMAKPEALNDWLEDSWRMMGVVPRYRYLELLERYELLRLRVEETEKKLQNMRKTLPMGKVPEQEAQQILDMWQNMLQETLKMQADWMRGWTTTGSGAEKPASSEAKDQPAGEAGKNQE
jgi:hypothetical protein